MKEIKIFLDKEKTNEVKDQIKFKEIMAGQTLLTQQLHGTMEELRKIIPLKIMVLDHYFGYHGQKTIL
jgi:hypothetical protein